MTQQNLYLPVFEEIKGVKGFFATKYGASEGSPYYHEEVLRAQGLENMQLIWPQQVHKAHIEIIEKCDSEPLRLPDTDGLVTNVPGVLLTTVHADCLPVFFYDQVRQAIGLVHAGWRGTLAGIAVRAIELLEKTYGSNPEDICAFIGPGISECCFETGVEVYRQFEDNWSFAGAFARPEGEKYYIDLKGINQQQLKDAGLMKIQISPHCTCCEPELFCSYRREGGTYHRMGAGLCLDQKQV